MTALNYILNLNAGGLVSPLQLTTTFTLWLPTEQRNYKTKPVICSKR